MGRVSYIYTNNSQTNQHYIIKHENHKKVAIECNLVNGKLEPVSKDHFVETVYSRSDFDKNNNIGGMAAIKQPSDEKEFLQLLKNIFKYLLVRNFESSATYQDLLTSISDIEITPPVGNYDVTSQVNNVRKEAVKKHKELKKANAFEDLSEPFNFEKLGKQYLFKAINLAIGATLTYFLLPRAGRFLNNLAIRYFNTNVGAALNNVVDSGVNIAANYVTPKLPVQLQNLTNQATVSSLFKKGGKVAAYAGGTVLGAGAAPMVVEASIRTAGGDYSAFIPNIKTTHRLSAFCSNAISRPNEAIVRK
ncbi:MAG: hypothetical protein J0H68_02010 [Sphingobacteriia bacterium]|nr:hypothetical protein [Sphingobacteriia bacterium]